MIHLYQYTNLDPHLYQNLAFVPPAEKTQNELLCKLPISPREPMNVDQCVFRGQNLNQYVALELLGKGSFGQVIKCYDRANNFEVAIKLLNPNKLSSPGNSEVRILRHLAKCDPDNLFVKYFRDFSWNGFHCVVLELLGQNLYDYLKRNNFTGMSFDEVQQISRQLVRAISRLFAMKIIHCDIKPENIALVYSSTGRKLIKIIDFGSSCVSGNLVYRYIQSRFYRAVEVILEIGYDAMIDTWSVGCVIVELLIGTPLFPGSNELEQLGYFIQTLGNIPEKLLRRSHKHSTYFYTSGGNIEFKLSQKFKPYSRRIPTLVFNCLSIKSYLSTSRNVHMDVNRVHALVDLVSRMLIYDPKFRLRPGDSMLSHPFISNNPYNMRQPAPASSYTFQSQLMPSPVGASNVQYQTHLPVHPPNQNFQTIPITITKQPIAPAVERIPPYFASFDNRQLDLSQPAYMVNYLVPYNAPLLAPISNMYNDVLIQNIPQSMNFPPTVIPPGYATSGAFNQFS